VMLGNGEANGVAINPTEWQTILTAKDTTGGYLQGGPFSPVASTVWGVPMLPTPAMAAGYSLVGDYSQGAQVFVREGVNVLISDSDLDDFTNNRVTLLAEGRFALAVWRPAVFSEVDLAA
jgi:HK97 family phage major capsid protein